MNNELPLLIASGYLTDIRKLTEHRKVLDNKTSKNGELRETNNASCNFYAPWSGVRNNVVVACNHFGSC